MSDKDFSKVPKYLDEKERLFFWTMDEALVLVGLVFIGIYTNEIVVGLFLAFMVQMLYAKIKKRMDLSVMSHLLYWALPTKLLRFLKSAPDSSVKEYIG